MQDPNYQDAAEYVFRLDDLQELVNNAPSSDTLVSIKLGYFCSDAEGGIYSTKVEAATGTLVGLSDGTKTGCPRPPGCTSILVSLGITS